MSKEKLIDFSLTHAPRFIIGLFIVIFSLGGIWVLFKNVPADLAEIKKQFIIFDKRLTIIEVYVEDKQREKYNLER